ncbi:hypothetical protein [Chryseobacterium taklimakanense]|uniref:hypothetical protein n=1 Tax=Chryseobacterium taklimakanense TaxID=536441 RepID=UPI0013DDF29C|nr:hypothetical protein [Chryseobacterium taklimakanense]
MSDTLQIILLCTVIPLVTLVAARILQLVVDADSEGGEPISYRGILFRHLAVSEFRNNSLIYF